MNADYIAKLQTSTAKSLTWSRNDMGGYTRRDGKFRIQPTYRGCCTVQGWRLESLLDNNTNRSYDRLADAKASVESI